LLGRKQLAKKGEPQGTSGVGQCNTLAHPVDALCAVKQIPLDMPPPYPPGDGLRHCALATRSHSHHYQCRDTRHLIASARPPPSLAKTAHDQSFSTSMIGHNATPWNRPSMSH